MPLADKDASTSMDGVKYERANQNEGYGSTSSSPRQPSTRDESGSSAFEAAINLSKLCIGSGILALPFAAERGGLLTMPLVIALVGLWNIGSCQLMISCKRACTSNGVMYATPPEVTSGQSGRTLPSSEDAYYTDFFGRGPESRGYLARSSASFETPRIARQISQNIIPDRIRSKRQDS